MPMSAGFAARLDVVLEAAAERFGTPFHIYDEQGLDETAALFHQAFAAIPYREYFAVKGLPNPVMLRRLGAHGFGFDCSSLPELTLAVQSGAVGHDICFTSNNTSETELRRAVDLGALITVDDETVFDKLVRLGALPETLCFRVHPGTGSGSVESYLGSAESAKFGVPMHRLAALCLAARERGVRSIGLHMMLGSGFLSSAPFLTSLDLLLTQAALLHAEHRIGVEFVNLGGGIGIPYHPDEPQFDLPGMGDAIAGRLTAWEHRYALPRPRVLFESGRYLMTPNGVLVTRVLNRMSKTREYVGVDAGMSALMRPAMYGAYHHVSVPRADGRRIEVVDVVGSLCENNDKFAQQRAVPAVSEGDLLYIHDTGAHALSMGFTYNGRLRPQELLLRTDGSVERIRRAEEERDYFATLDFPSARLEPQVTAAKGA